MNKPEALAVRRRIMGLVLRSTRLARERSVEDCAKLLQLSDEAILQIERGERDLSLPELEVLAQFLGRPVADVLAGKMLAKEGGPDLRSPQARLIRNKIIGLSLRRARQGKSRAKQQRMWLPRSVVLRRRWISSSAARPVFRVCNYRFGRILCTCRLPIFCRRLRLAKPPSSPNRRLRIRWRICRKNTRSL